VSNSFFGVVFALRDSRTAKHMFTAVWPILFICSQQCYWLFGIYGPTNDEWWQCWLMTMLMIC